ncbi:LOG family protein [Rhodococcus chondri]|uniref:Cytokinin riboside 5'-monophosphate phosphoribohydrolase n=1 Tax=Rhodococcus chondri TaxID=3065941 RepID=A0ABU7JWQ0_9NOCA|nr:TIGR00730 family Rossman fold protein [Rhodococcus sp. CC-R104]MEE2034451.1 TIGR00730 family Rossman fold protein [Rhodococcus sp. CC-R104]
MSVQPDGPISVCVYCASGPVGQPYLDLAADVGAEIGRRGWQLISGGGNVSMMGAIADAARAAGAHTVGVIPKALVHREVADVDADELIVTDTMRERKRIMEDRADAFITLPGGIGTLEELFETWTAGYLGMHDKPVVLLDPGGHYAGLLAWLESMVDTGFVARRALDGLQVTDDIADALDRCRAPQRPGPDHPSTGSLSALR